MRGGVWTRSGILGAVCGVASGYGRVGSGVGLRNWSGYLALGGK